MFKFASFAPKMKIRKNKRDEGVLFAKQGLKRLRAKIGTSIRMSKFLHFTRGSPLDCQIIDAEMMLLSSKKQKPRH